MLDKLKSIKLYRLAIWLVIGGIALQVHNVFFPPLSTQRLIVKIKDSFYHDKGNGYVFVRDIYEGEWDTVTTLYTEPAQSSASCTVNQNDLLQGKSAPENMWGLVFIKNDKIVRRYDIRINQLNYAVTPGCFSREHAILKIVPEKLNPFYTSVTLQSIRQ